VVCEVGWSGVWVGVGDEAERERKKERNDTIIKKGWEKTQWKGG